MENSKTSEEISTELMAKALVKPPIIQESDLRKLWLPADEVIPKSEVEAMVKEILEVLMWNKVMKNEVIDIAKKHNIEV